MQLKTLSPEIIALLDALPCTRIDPLQEAEHPANEFVKAGILPFLPAATTENWRFCVMKPVAARPELGLPAYQLCKGTRMRYTPSGWVDLKSTPSEGEKVETLKETAIREGMEELGLLPSHIVHLWELGPVSFHSASTGKEKWLWLFAAEMADEEGFTSSGEVAFTTAARSWLTVGEFALEGRSDFAKIIEISRDALVRHHN